MTVINENTTVRELLSAHPSVFAVFLRHGMCADCQTDPPPVPLHRFAAKHCGGNVVELIAELNAAIGG